MRHLIYISVLADFNKTPLRRNSLCDLRVIGEMDALVSGKVPRRPLIHGIGHRAIALYWRVAYRHWSMTALVGGLEQFHTVKTSTLAQPHTIALSQKQGNKADAFKTRLRCKASPAGQRNLVFAFVDINCTPCRQS
jgi:hypothetical protein